MARAERCGDRVRHTGRYRFSYSVSPMVGGVAYGKVIRVEGSSVSFIWNLVTFLSTTCSMSQQRYGS